MGGELVSKLIEREHGDTVPLCACKFRTKYVMNE